jgi:hypothetical protein
VRQRFTMDRGAGIVCRTRQRTRNTQVLREKSGCGKTPGIWVEGEAGIGKTWLVNQFLDELNGFTVLPATGSPAESALPYGLVEQLTIRASREDWTEFGNILRGHLSTAEPFAIGAHLLDLAGRLQTDRPLVFSSTIYSGLIRFRRKRWRSCSAGCGSTTC